MDVTQSDEQDVAVDWGASGYTSPPAPVYYVRIGVLARVGRLAVVDGRSYPRMTRVVCRTARGLEVGEVLGLATTARGVEQCDGTLLRSMSAEDELLVARLNKNREAAFQACHLFLQQLGSDTVLMEVEQLFDTASLYFYFLGSVSPEVEVHLQQLAQVYESKVQFGSFIDAVEHGCGPGCGTEEGAGCGVSCVSCDLANACKSSIKT